MSPWLEARLDEYSAVHRTRGNEICHAIGIPLIIVGAARLLALVPLLTVGDVTLTLAELVVAGAAIFYFSLDRRLALLVTSAMLALVLGGRQLPVAVGGAALVVGWAFQLVGHHRFERRAPAFTRNLAHLLIGPLWMLVRGFRSHGST